VESVEEFGHDEHSTDHEIAREAPAKFFVVPLHFF